MPISATEEFIDHYTNIYHYAKNVNTHKNIMFVKSRKEVKYFDKSKCDVIYCLPKIIRQKLTCKTFIINKDYSIPTFREICSVCKEGLWIEKPINGSCGLGISILSSPTL